MTDQTALRDRIAEAIRRAPSKDLRADWNAPNGPLQITARVNDLADAVLAVLPAPADRVTVLREAADRFDRHVEQLLDGIGGKAVFVAKALRDQAAVWSEAAETLRRMAAESAPATAPQPVRHAPGKAILCPDCRSKGHSVCMADEQPAVAQQQPKEA